MAKRPEVAWTIKRVDSTYKYLVTATVEIEEGEGSSACTIEDCTYSDVRLLCRALHVPILVRRLRRKKRSIERSPEDSVVASGVAR